MFPEQFRVHVGSLVVTYANAFYRFTDSRGTYFIGERIDGGQETDFAAETSTETIRKQYLLLSMNILQRARYNHTQ